MKAAANNIGPLSTSRAAPARDILGVAASLRLHWPEYLMEAGEMSLYMFCTCSFALFYGVAQFSGATAVLRSQPLTEGRSRG